MSAGLLTLIKAVLVPHAEKLRIVLSKVDTVSDDKLLEVVADLSWVMGRVFADLGRPQICIAPPPSGAAVRVSPAMDLLAELKDLPKKSGQSKVNDFVVRAQVARMHGHVVSYLKERAGSNPLPKMSHARALDRIRDEMDRMCKERQLPRDQVPCLEILRDMLSGRDIAKFEGVKSRAFSVVEEMLTQDIPSLLEEFTSSYDMLVVEPIESLIS